MSDVRDAHGWIDPLVATELPGLSLMVRAVAAPDSDDAEPGVEQRLGELAGRWYGAQAAALRAAPVAAAYRACFRQIGIDPDVTRTPIEAAVVERLVTGGFRSSGRLADALLLALVETSVPVWALDGDAVDGALGLRVAQPGERLGRAPEALPAGAGGLVLCDHAAPLAPLFGAPAPDVAPTAATTQLLLAALGVDGVSELQLDEALWICAQALAPAAPTV